MFRVEMVSISYFKKIFIAYQNIPLLLLVFPFLLLVAWSALQFFFLLLLVPIKNIIQLIE